MNTLVIGVVLLSRHMLPAHLSPPPGHLSNRVFPLIQTGPRGTKRTVSIKKTIKGGVIHKYACPLLAGEKEGSFFTRPATEWGVKAQPGNWREYFRDRLAKATRQAM
jgi:hypothetical protein